VDGFILATRGPAFRFALATGLAVIVAVVVLTRLWLPGVSGPAFGSDLRAYEFAAQRENTTGQPYSQELLSGPIENRYENVPIGYFYTPVLAQVFAGLGIRADDLKAPWALCQIVLLGVLVVLVARRYGGARRIPATIAVLALTAASEPVNVALFIGNISGIVAIVVAVMLLDRPWLSGVAAGAIAVVKPTAIPLGLVAFVNRRSRFAALATAAGVVVISLAAAPVAWAAFASVIPNLLLLPMSNWTANWSPAALLNGVGLAAIGRILGLATVGGCGLLAIWWARRTHEWPRAVAAATLAMTFAGVTVWDHYLAPLVPIMIAAWPAAGAGRRTLLAAGFSWHLVPVLVAPTDPLIRVAGLFAMAATIAGLLGRPINAAVEERASSAEPVPTRDISFSNVAR